MAHDAKIHRGFSGSPSSMVGGNLPDTVFQIMGADDNLGKNKKGMGPQLDFFEELPRPGLGPVVIVNAEFEEKIQKENINDRDKKTPEPVGISLPAHSQDHVRVLGPTIQKQFDKRGQFGAVELLIRADVHEVFPTRPRDPVFQRRGVALVFLMKNQVGNGVSFNGLEEHTPRVILASVLNYDEFPIPLRMCRKYLVEVREDIRDVAFLVINGNDEAD